MVRSPEDSPPHGRDVEIGEIVVSESQLTARVSQLGQQIDRDYAGLSEPLVLIGILKGCFVFLGDLCRAVHLPLVVDVMAVTSYGADRESSGSVRILHDLETSIRNRHVLIVEGIVDTGLTLHYLLAVLQARSPSSLKVCTLLDKPARRMAEVPIAYRGFEIPDRFVIGYGLDVDQRHRNLPYVAALQE